MGAGYRLWNGAPTTVTCDTDRGTDTVDRIGKGTKHARGKALDGHLTHGARSGLWGAKRMTPPRPAAGLRPRGATPARPQQSRHRHCQHAGSHRPGRLETGRRLRLRSPDGVRAITVTWDACSPTVSRVYVDSVALSGPAELTACLGELSNELASFHAASVVCLTLLYNASPFAEPWQRRPSR